jgi:hypothetical protein
MASAELVVEWIEELSPRAILQSVAQLGPSQPAALGLDVDVA